MEVEIEKTESKPEGFFIIAHRIVSALPFLLLIISLIYSIYLKGVFGHWPITNLDDDSTWDITDRFFYVGIITIMLSVPIEIILCGEVDRTQHTFKVWLWIYILGLIALVLFIYFDPTNLIGWWND